MLYPDGSHGISRPAVSSIQAGHVAGISKQPVCCIQGHLAHPHKLCPVSKRVTVHIQKSSVLYPSSVTWHTQDSSVLYANRSPGISKRAVCCIQAGKVAYPIKLCPVSKQVTWQMCISYTDATVSAVHMPICANQDENSSVAPPDSVHAQYT